MSTDMAKNITDRATPNDNYDLKVEACATCRFWWPDMDRLADGINDASFDLGDCRRRPPEVIEALAAICITPPKVGMQIEIGEAFSVQDAYHASQHPATHFTDWCGEFAWLPKLQPGKVPL